MTMAINLTAIIISSIALVVALAALAMVIGMKLSTHRIEWKTMETFEPFEKDEELSLADPNEDEVNAALKLSAEGRNRKKQNKDPLDEILESTNF